MLHKGNKLLKRAFLPRLTEVGGAANTDKAIAKTDKILVSFLIFSLFVNKNARSEDRAE